MTPSEFWIYAHVPVPGVYALSVVNEAANSRSGSPQIQNLSFLCPATTDTVDEWVPNANINGWDVTKDPCLHSSWGPTYSGLGWGAKSLPTDARTNFLLSGSSMWWISSRLNAMKNFKVYSSQLIFQSRQGSAIQSYFLIRSEDPGPAGDMISTQRERVDSRLRETIDMPWSLCCQLKIKPSLTSAAFSFRYRMKRDKVRSADQKDELDRLNSQTFYAFKDGALVDPGCQWTVGANAFFMSGSQEHINAARFHTMSLQRSVGLSIALAPIWSSEIS